MINKKILAAAIATAFTMNNAAAIDMDDAAATGVTVASEATGTVTAGMYALTNAASALDQTTEIGFAMAGANEKYIRVDLTNATFAAAPAVTSTNLASAAIQTGGTAGDSFVVFKAVANGTGLASSEVLTIATSSYNVSSTAASSVTYGLYETALSAINKADDSTYKISDGPLVASTAAVTTGVVVTTPVVGVGSVTATSASAFKAFKAEGSTTATTANLGSVDAAKIVDGSTALAADGAVVEATDLIPTTAQVITFKGDFSAGTFSANTNTDCTTAGSIVATTLNDAESELATAAVNPHVPVFLCQVVDGKAAVAKNTYTAELASGQTGTVGTITYDTTSIAIPYLTTFSGYNQRIYLLNTSNTAANYTMSFTSEAGVTAVDGTAATGSVPANSMLTIKASDIVTLTGKTRTSAVIEVETADSNISATTQTVTLSDGSTDTLVLN